MSINLDLQNWLDASSKPPQPSSALPQVIMNRSAADKANNADDDLWSRSCLKKLSNTCTEEEQGSTIKSSQPVFTSEEHQMLNFSAGSHKVIPHLPYFYNNYASHHNNPNFTGYSNYCGGGATKMHDLINGPFTASQWTELEHQALIYKHITSSMPVPSTLLTPIRRALSHAAFPGYNSGHFSSMGWGGFHLGLQNSNDPEPGRCRRTDGKKWRCSRDAVADQKYCERHINRGRHRSRKPVEGQSSYSVGKPVPASSTALAGNIGSMANGLIPEKRKICHNEKNTHLGTFESVHNSRSSCDGIVQADSHNLLVPPPSLVLHPRESLYNIHNSKPAATYGQLFGSDFGLVSSDALKNPSGQTTIHKNVTNKQIRPHSTPIHQFIDDCPKNLPDHTSTMWPNLYDTQLSISIPTAYHHIKDSQSPLTLASEFDSMPTGLELGGSKHIDEQPESEDNYPNWIPILSDSIIGGPLGEVLQNNSVTNSAKTETDVRWGKGPRFTSSPTGVLQKEAAFASRTNSSAGSSPRAENS